MGRVYLARTPGGRSVAVKVVHPELARDPEFRRRFAREVAAARAVDGRFTAQVLDAGVDDPTPWLSTVFVPGMSLAEAVAEHGPFPEEPALALARGLAAALTAVHAAGLVHRDLKPSNVLLGPDGPRVIDFGISRATEASALTRTGTTVGSPGFMSPEQAGGGTVGAASDVFSFGTVLAFTLTGESPFGTGATPALLYRVVHAEPRLEGLSGVALDLVRRCLAKDPAQRPSPAALLAELSAGAGAGGPDGARPEGSAWLPAAVANSLLARASSALEADSGPAPAAAPVRYEPTRVDPAPAGPAPRPTGFRGRIRTAPLLAAVAVVVAASIGALAYTSHQDRKETERSHVSQDDNDDSPSDTTGTSEASDAADASDTPSPEETTAEPSGGATTPEEPAPETTGPLDDWSLADEADVRLPTGYGFDASDFKTAKAGSGFDVDLHRNWDLAGDDILLLKDEDSDVNSDCLADAWASGYGTLVEDADWGIGDKICVRPSSDVLLVLQVTDISDEGQDDHMGALAKLWKRQ